MSGRLIARAGPFQGVRATPDTPYLDWSLYLSDAYQGYIRWAEGQSSWVVRPNFTKGNSTNQLGTGQRTQGSCVHVDPTTGTSYRFFAVNGVLYRLSSAFNTPTVVTPVATVINLAATKVAFTSVGAALVVSDGVNRPWVMSDFGSTPVTGTYIDIDGAAGAWAAFGRPTVYQGSVFFIVSAAPGGSAINAGVGLVWSEPNQPAVGYTQTGYADYWNLIEIGTEKLYAIFGTNNGIFYWRENSIGVLTGTPSISFSSTATRDAVSTNVGTMAPFAVAQFNENIFFIDTHGRPWMFRMGAEPQPIWRQLTGYTENQNTFAATTQILAVGNIAPELNQYVVAQYPTGASANVMHVFDGETGAYGGKWAIDAGIGIDVLDQSLDANDSRILIACGGLTSGQSGGYLWKLALIDLAAPLETNAAAYPYCTTGPLTAGADKVMYPQSAVLVFHSLGAGTVWAAMTATVITSNGSSTVTFTPTAARATGTLDSVRIVVGLDGVATRALQFKVQNNTLGPGAASSPALQRVEVYGRIADAGPNDL